MEALGTRGFAAQAALPAEIAAVLPHDPYTQLDLAHKIAEFALSQTASHLESEVINLRETVNQKNNVIKTLERKIANQELELQELQAKNQQHVEEQHRSQAEKAALIDAVKKLNREVTRLEAFKKNLIQQLHEGDESAFYEAPSSAVDFSSERLVAEVLSTAAVGPSAAAAAAHAAPHASAFASRGTPASAFYRTPAGMPSGASMMRAPPGSPPGRMPISVAPLPTYPRAGGMTTMQPHASTAAPQPQPPMPAAPAEPPAPASPPRVDGKEFFKQARSRLSYEAFNQFLAMIKDLNAGRASRDETLGRAKELFGYAHRDLYASFDSLLSRHHMSAF